MRTTMLAGAYLLAAVAVAVLASYLTHRGTPEILGSATVILAPAILIGVLTRRRQYAHDRVARYVLATAALVAFLQLYARVITTT